MENEQSENNIEENQAALNVDHKCTVCHKAYCEPKLLPCGHLMCRKCLLSWLMQTRRATCPYCRYPILKGAEDSQTAPADNECKEDVPTEGDQGCTEVDDTELQKLVDGFPTELWTSALVKAQKLLREKQKCRACDEEATSICHQCGDTLCASCKDVHSRLTATRHHVMEELSGLTAERLADVQTPTPCPQHPDEPCRLFCPQHDTSLCQECMISSHQDCSKITSFGKQVEEAKMKLMQLMKVMTDSTAAMDGALTELDQHLADMEQREKTALADIETLKERLCKAVEDRYQHLKLQVNKALADIREAVKEAKGVLLGRQSRLGSHTALARGVHTSTAGDVVCCMTSVMEARLNDLDRRLDKPYGSKIITTAALTVDDNAVLRVEKELAELGSINVQFTPIAANAYEVFHHNHGKDVTLGNDDRKATFPQYGAMAVRKPVALGDLVEVEIDLWAEDGIGAIGLCLTGTAPEVIDLHESIYDIPCSWVIGTSGASIDSKYQGSANELGQHLKSVEQGSRVGLLLDHNLHLHLHIDGRDCGVFLEEVPPACYAVFKFYNSNNPVQITLLPRRKIEM